MYNDFMYMSYKSYSNYPRILDTELRFTTYCILEIKTYSQSDTVLSEISCDKLNFSVKSS